MLILECDNLYYQLKWKLNVIIKGDKCESGAKFYGFWLLSWVILVKFF